MTRPDGAPAPATHAGGGFHRAVQSGGCHIENPGVWAGCADLPVCRCVLRCSRLFWLPREGTPLGRASHPHHAHPHHAVLLGKRFQENSDHQTPGNPISPDLSRGLVDPKVWHCWGLRGVWYSSGLVLLGSHGTHVGQCQAHPRPPPRITTAPPPPPPPGKQSQHKTPSPVLPHPGRPRVRAGVQVHMGSGPPMSGAGRPCPPAPFRPGNQPSPHLAVPLACPGRSLVAGPPPWLPAGGCRSGAHDIHEPPVLGPPPLRMIGSVCKGSRCYMFWCHGLCHLALSELSTLLSLGQARSTRAAPPGHHNQLWPPAPPRSAL